MSLLSMIQNVAASVNTTIPTSIVGNPNADARQWLVLAQMTVREIGRRHDWQGLVATHTWTSTATEAQASATPASFDHFINDVQIWNQSTNQLLTGPTPSNDWIDLQSSGVTGGGPGYWRYFGGALHIYPTPSAGDTYAFDYVSNQWVIDGLTFTVTSSAWAVDTDDISFGAGSIVVDLMELGLVWRWLRAHGMDYAEEMSSFERELEKAAARDRGIGVMVLDRRRGPSSWPGTVTP